MSELTLEDRLAIQAESLWTRSKELRLDMSDLQATGDRDPALVQYTKGLRKEFETFAVQALPFGAFKADVRDLDPITFDLEEEAAELARPCVVQIVSR